MSFRDISKKKLWLWYISNILSLIFSLTALVIAAHISAQYKGISNSSKKLQPNDIEEDGIMDSLEVVREDKSNTLLPDSNISSNDVNDNQNDLDKDEIDKELREDNGFDMLSDLNYAEDHIVKKKAQIEKVASSNRGSAKKTQKPVLSYKVKVIIPTRAPKFIKGNILSSSQENVTKSSNLDNIVTKSSNVENVIKNNSKSLTLMDKTIPVFEGIPNSNNSNNKDKKDSFPPISLYPSTAENIYDKNNSTNETKELSPNKRYNVQLGSFNRHSDALKVWFRVRNANFNLLEQKKYRIKRIDSDEGDSYVLYFYVSSKEEGNSICDTLSKGGTKCSVT